MEAFYASLGALAILAGYTAVKKIGRSKCAVDHCSGCLSCTSPELELAKKNTERMDEIFELIKQINPTLQAPLGEVRLAVNDATTTEGKTTDGSSVAY